MNYDLIIIGAGAAGLYAAYRASLIKPDAKVLILEKTAVCGTKVLLSGNGQCNFTHHETPEAFLKHYGDQSKFVKPAVYELTAQTLIDDFSQHGIYAHIRDDGKVFPQSLNAADIRDFLQHSAQSKGFEFKNNQNILSISKNDHLFVIKTSRTQYQAKHLLITTGGKSYQITGTQWNAYELIESLGHTINELKPALCPPVFKNFHYASLMGISFQNITMTLIKTNKKKKNFVGDMLFTHFGVSGPLVLDASRYFEKGDILQFNFTPFKNYESFLEDFIKLCKKNPRKIIKNILNYYPIPNALVLMILQDLNISATQDIFSISKQKTEKLLRAFCAFQLEISELGSFKTAMVTHGGVSLKEVSSKSMESKLLPKLYFAGEVLDVDADTGGYNIHFAFASAKLAIDHIFKKT